jgi:hypothetical protein
MATSIIRQSLALVALLTALAACTATPTPRGNAQEGATVSGDRSAHNASYYQGADPVYHRQRSDGGP